LDLNPTFPRHADPLAGYTAAEYAAEEYHVVLAEVGGGQRGENRGRFYLATPVVLAVRRETSEPRRRLPDPFADSAAS
jgi:hypothetical protein